MSEIKKQPEQMPEPAQSAAQPKRAAQPNAGQNSTAHRRRKRRRGLSTGMKILWAAIVLALMGASFFAGWQLGVQSTRFQGKILLVNESNPLPADYVPEDLVNLYEQRHSFRLMSSDIYLTRETYASMERMFAAAEAEGMNGFTVTGGYRTYSQQAQLYAETEAGKALKPGCSEHQTGLAFDITVAGSTSGLESTPQFAWLLKNAWKYGFIQRYPANKAEETGIGHEPGHFRYVGDAAAKEIHESGLSLERFIERNAG